MESPSFLSCTQLCRRQKIIKPDLEMPDLEDHEYREKGGHGRQLGLNSFHMLLTWRQYQPNGQFIWSSEKHLVEQHRADWFEKVVNMFAKDWQNKFQ